MYANDSRRRVLYSRHVGYRSTSARSEDESLTGQGALIARALAGSWRNEPELLALGPKDLAAIAPLCLAFGVGPLVWRRIANSALRRTAAAADFQAAYRHAAVSAALHQETLTQLIGRLRAGGVEPLLVKGWAAARLYPQPGLRVYSDHDICVRRSDYARARTIVGAASDLTCVVDLHDGVKVLDDADEDDLYARSIEVNCGAMTARILSAEDQLRVLCRHLLRHGAARPLWLCDVACAVETRRPDFDWERCLGPNRRVRGWVVSTLQLAHEVLGMSLDGAPVAERPSPLPRWLIPTVLDAWALGPVLLPRVGLSLDSPLQILRDWRRHWPDPITATIAVRGPINEAPRLAFQVASFVPGAARIVRDAVDRWQRKQRASAARTQSAPSRNRAARTASRRPHR